MFLSSIKARRKVVQIAAQTLVEKHDQIAKQTINTDKQHNRSSWRRSAEDIDKGNESDHRKITHTCKTLY